jgi:hypothetical protein
MGALILGGCADTITPLDSLRSHLVVSTTAALTGDILVLEASATNMGRAVFHTSGCGQGLDVRVLEPSGAMRLILSGLPSICPVFDSNVLEPRETDTVRINWTVPPQPGTYSLRAGVRTEAGLAALSAPVSVVVRAP